MKPQKCTVSMDAKQRICLARVLSQEEREAFSSFRIYREGGKIVLEPVAEVPEKDHWIYKNPKALKSLLKGIKDAEEAAYTIWALFRNMQQMKLRLRTNNEIIALRGC